MMSSGQGLSSEYLVRVNGSGDWLTAALGLLYGNEEHERRAEECEGQKTAAAEEQEEQEGGGQSPGSASGKIHRGWFTAQVETAAWAGGKKQKELSVSALEMTVWVLRSLPEHLGPRDRSLMWIAVIWYPDF